MRKSFIIAAVLVAALTSCQKEVQEISEAGVDAVKAMREAPAGDTKASVGKDGAFVWMAEDAIGIYDGKAKWYEYTTASDKISEDGSTATFSRTDIVTRAKSKYAVYPYAIADKDYAGGEDLTVIYPSEYDWVADQTSVPMLATFDDASKGLSFKHLGGLVKVTINGVPAGEGSLAFWATGKRITGQFAVDMTGDSPVVNTAEGDDKVTISFNNAEKKDMVFYIPVPAGKYVFNVEFSHATLDEALTVNGTKEQTVSRTDLLSMAAFTLSDDSVDGSGGTKATATVTVDQAYPGATTIYLPATTADVNVYFTVAQNQTITLAYNTLSSDRPANVTVSADEYTLSGLTINLPESTVTLVDGTYGTVTASTAANTLVVSKEVKINSALTVNAGNLEFNGMTKNNATVTINNAASSVKVGAYDNGAGRIATLTVTNGKDVTVLGQVGTLTLASAESLTVAEGAEVTTAINVTKATSVTVAEGAKVAALGFGSSTASCEIAGEVGTLTCGASAQIVTITTSGKVSTTLTNSNNATVYLEQATTETVAQAKARVPDAASVTILNLGLQKLITDNESTTGGTFTLTDNCTSDAAYTVSKKLTINVNNKEVTGKFYVKSGATLTLTGAGTLEAGSDGAIIEIEKGGSVVLGDGSNAIAYNGNIVNEGSLTIKDKAVNTFDGAIDNTAATAFLVVASGIELPEVIEAEGTMAYAATAASFQTYADAKNDDEAKSWKFSKIVVNAAYSSVASSFSIGSATAASRTLAVELRGDITMSGEVDAFKIVNAAVKFSAPKVDANGKKVEAGSTERTITGHSNKSVFSLTGLGTDAAASAYADGYTALTLCEGVKLGGATGITIAKSSYGVKIDSKADMSSLSGVSINVGSVSYAAGATNYPKIDLTGGKLKYITANGYAEWNLKGVEVTNSGAVAVALSKGVMNVYSVKDSNDKETTKVTGSGYDAFAVSGGTLNIEGGEITGTDAIEVSKCDALTVSGGKVTSTTNALNITSTNTAVKGVEISGGEIAGKIFVSGTATTAVNGFIASSAAKFSDVSAANFGGSDEDGNAVEVNIVLTAPASDGFTVNKDSKVKLDLGGQTGNGAITVALGGELTVVDGSEDKTATVTGNFTNNGTVVLSGGTYTKIVNQGAKMTIEKGVKLASDGGVIENGYADYASYNEATNAAAPVLEITGGEFKSTAATTIKNQAGGDLRISGGTFVNNAESDGVCIDNVSEATVTGGSFNGVTVVNTQGFNATDDYGQTGTDPHRRGVVYLSGDTFIGALTAVKGKGDTAIIVTGGIYSVNPGAYIDTNYYGVSAVLVDGYSRYKVAMK